MPLAEKRRDRYARLQDRLAGMQDETAQSSSLPEYLRMDTAYPEIWRLDVIEWEQDGDAAETMAEVLQDTKWPDYTRRRALLCRLHQLSSESPPTPQTLASLAVHLGKVEIYAALAPLERMYTHEDANVRTAAMRAVRQLFFKRSYVLIMQGLRDADGNVRRAALDAVKELHFPHAFDPLARIYRDSNDAAVRKAVLVSIGKIPNVDAAEMLIDVLRHGDRDERTQARDILIKADMPDVDGLLQRAAAGETGQPRADIDQVLRSRGRVPVRAA
jgi:HEAT repeat protein